MLHVAFSTLYMIKLALNELGMLFVLQGFLNLLVLSFGEKHLPFPHMQRSMLLVTNH